MAEIMIKAAGFVFVIIIAFVLKQIHVLEKRDGLTIATIIMNVTLPCALLTNASGITIDQSMIILLLIGLTSNIIMLLISFILSRKEENVLKGYYMINCSGYNIGNFVMPFVQSFFPGMGVAYLCMFDVGNSIMCLGGSYAFAGSVASSNQKLTPKTVIKKLFSSIPFDVYIVIFFLALFKIKIPAPILSITDFIGAGNGFLAMLMIGLLLEIKISHDDFKDLISILSYRLLGNMLLMALCFFLLPLPLLAKKILIIALAAPISTVSAVFTRQCKYEGEVAAVANSLSILIGIGVLVVLLMLFV